MDFEESCDVIVAGAGVAGASAALASARAGMRTALVEKTVFTGGLATAGLVNIYLPLCDGNGTQVTFGIAEELLHLSIRYGPGGVPAEWRGGTDAAEEARYRVVFSPASFVLALDEALEAAGVEIMLDTRVARPVTESGAVTGLEVENVSGRGRLSAPVVVDATGDASVAHRAGCGCELGGNWTSMWALQASLERAREAAASGDCTGLTGTLRLGVPEAGGATGCAAETFAGAADVTRFVLDGRRSLREYYREKHAAGGDTGRRNLYPLTLPAMPQLRTIRRIAGRESLTDGRHATRFRSSIGLVADWRKPGFVWEVPFGTMIPAGGGGAAPKGLLVAGRCIGSGGDAWEVTRVIPACALTGEAAGVAAAVAVRGKKSPDEIDPAEVQARMRELGVPVHLDEVGL